MGATIELLLLSVLCASIGTVQGACRHVQNDDMVEYSCEGGQLSDLDSLPASTEKIQIVDMPVAVLTEDMFARFGSNLWVLGCSRCRIRDIEPRAFKRLENLQQLSLVNNQLTTVRGSWFEGLNYLTYLDLNYNAIRTIDDSVFQNLPSLVELRLSGNRLECLNLQGMSDLKELKRIFLTENPEFKCPNAVSAYLENRGVSFEKDSEWNQITRDLVTPPVFEYDYYDTTTLPPYRDRLRPTPPTPRPEEPSTPRPEYSQTSSSEYPSTSPHWSQKVQTTEEVVLTQDITSLLKGLQWPTTPDPNLYEDEDEQQTVQSYVPPRTIVLLESATDPPNQQSGVDKMTLGPSSNRPEYPSQSSYGNEDSRDRQQPTQTLAPVQNHQQQHDHQPSSEEPDVNRAIESNANNLQQKTDLSPPSVMPPENEMLKVSEPVTNSPVSSASPASVHGTSSVSGPMAPQSGPTTTDKPLPDCPSSSSTVERSFGVVILAVLMVLTGHGFVEGF